MGCCVARINGQSASGVTAQEQGVIVEDVTPAAAVGTTDDRVLLFNAASIQLGSVPLASWLSRSDTAALGTVLTITQSGFYQVWLSIPWGTGQNAGAYITKNATANQRQVGAAIDFNEREIYGGHFKQGTTVQGHQASGVIPVTAADIAAGDNTIRGHAWNPISPAAVIAQPGAFVNGPVTCIKLWRIGDIVG